MCWKDEWEAAIKNLDRAIKHISRAQKAVEKRCQRYRTTLSKLKYPSEKAPVEMKLKKHEYAVQQSKLIIAALTEFQCTLRCLIASVGISRKKKQQ